MQRGHPLQIEQVLPFGMTGDEVLIVLLSLGLLMVAWSIGQYLFERDRFTPRLKMIQERRNELKQHALHRPANRRKPVMEGQVTLIRRIVSALKLLQQHQVTGLQQKLQVAGYRSKDAVIFFAFAKLAAPILGLILALLLVEIDWSQPFTTGEATHWLGILVISYLAARLPEVLVANKKAKRLHSLRKALPDALDLMMICAEAGLSLAAALDRVSKELSRMSPVLAEEFSLTSVELGFLPDRATALKHLAERTELQEMRGFVNVITQTEKYGTPVAQALRVLAKEFRTQRMLRAEQKAARLPALMTVPMIVFILPALFIVVMAPAIIGVMDVGM